MSVVRLIQVPYHLGTPGWNVANGPGRMVEAGGVAALEAAGRTVERLTLTLPEEELTTRATSENGRVFALARMLALATREAVLSGETPVVLAGGCTSCWGTISGVGAAGTGIVWLDAHPDLNTPSTSASGFLEGMALGVATGHGWEAARRSIPGYGPVALDRVLLVGVRDLDPPEAELIARAGVPVGDGSDLPGRLEALAPRLGVGGGVYLHIDLDVLDPSVGKANAYAAPGGLTTRQVVDAVAAVAAILPIRAAALTALNPEDDLSGGAADAAVEILGAIGRAVGNSP